MLMHVLRKCAFNFDKLTQKRTCIGNVDEVSFVPNKFVWRCAGPGMGGGMDADWNMNMGNMPGPDMGMRGPMGPGFHPMQGPGPGMGGNGPVMPGPRMRNNRRGGPGKIHVC